MIWRKLWIAFIVFVPVVPKVKVLQVGEYPILCDDVVLLVAVALGVVAHVGAGKGRIFVSRVGIVFGCLFLYKVLNLLVLALFNPWGGLSDRGYAILFHEGLMVLSRLGSIMAVYLLVFHFFRSRQEVVFVVKLYIASVVCVVAYSLGQYFILDHPVLTGTFRNLHVLGQVNPGWGVKNPWTDPSATGHEHLGAFVIMALAVVGGGIMYRCPESGRARGLATALWLAGVFVLMMCSSRGSWIGAVFAVAACLVLAVRRRKTAFILWGALMAGVGLGALYAADFNFSLHVEKRVEQLPALLEGRVEDDSAKHRLNLLKILWGMFQERPLIGWGAGGGGRIVEGQMQREVIEGGVVGGALFLFLVAISGKMALAANRMSANPLTQGLGFGYACGLVGLMGQALFTELFILVKVIVPFWVIGAVVHRLYLIESRSAVAASRAFGGGVRELRSRE